MDFSMEIASMAMNLKAAQYQQNYSLAVVDKAMDTMEQVGQELEEMLPEEIPLPKGEFLDVYA